MPQGRPGDRAPFLASIGGSAQTSTSRSRASDEIARSPAGSVQSCGRHPQRRPQSSEGDELPHLGRRYDYGIAERWNAARHASDTNANILSVSSKQVDVHHKFWCCARLAIAGLCQTRRMAATRSRPCRHSPSPEWSRIPEHALLRRDERASGAKVSAGRAEARNGNRAYHCAAI